MNGEWQMERSGEAEQRCPCECLPSRGRAGCDMIADLPSFQETSKLGRGITWYMREEVYATKPRKGPDNILKTENKHKRLTVDERGV